MARIVDLEDLARRGGHETGAAFRRRIAAGRMIRMPAETVGEVAAEVNHGRWIARCPFCSGAELVSRVDAVFFCFSCHMEGNGGRAMRVLFPCNRRQIEVLLEQRPIHNQHWLPGESKADLARENREHGL